MDYTEYDNSGEIVLIWLQKLMWWFAAVTPKFESTTKLRGNPNKTWKLVAGSILKAFIYGALLTKIGGKKENIVQLSIMTKVHKCEL